MSICRRCIVKVLSVHIGAMMTYLRVSIEFTRPLNAKSEVKSNKSFLLIKLTFFGWIYIGLVLRGCEVVETSWSWCPVLTWARFIRGRGWDPSPCESQAGPGEETIGGPGATARPGSASAHTGPGPDTSSVSRRAETPDYTSARNWQHCWTFVKVVVCLHFHLYCQQFASTLFLIQNCILFWRLGWRS